MFGLRFCNFAITSGKDDLFRPFVIPAVEVVSKLIIRLKIESDIIPSSPSQKFCKQ